MQKTHWKIAPEPTQTDLETLNAPSTIVARLLWNRGLRTAEDVAAFLDPSWDAHLHDPSVFRHMNAAAERVFRALSQGERITVHGDYDADGVTGSVVLISTLKELGVHYSPNGQANLDYYIPHRDKEGYGLHLKTVETLHARGTQVIITVDCGIACVNEIALAREKGMDVIVVDHHQFGETLPDAHLIHPGLPGETYPFSKLAAVGVAFKFASALIARARADGKPIKEGWEKWLLDLVAIATITDVVPLIGENRLLERYGLKVMNKTRRPGLRALIDAAKLSWGAIDSESIGFAIGPRINAAGRMDHAELALTLLLSETEEEARVHADALERCNRLRQDATRKMVAEAEAMITERFKGGALPEVLVLWNEAWSPALVGLAAGKFMERFGRPVVMIGSHEGTWIGSGRSSIIYDITQAVRRAGDELLARSGGHIQACGFALTSGEHAPAFAERLEKDAAQHLQVEQLRPTLEIDMELPLHEVSLPLVESMAALEPFGEGNRRPIFLSKNIPVVKTDTMGSRAEHVRFLLLDERGRRVKALGFSMADRLLDIHVDHRVDVVYTISVNTWQGTSAAELRLLDIRRTT